MATVSSPRPEPPAPHFPAVEHARLVNVEALSKNWYVLRKITFDLCRRDGQWQRQSREAYDRGNGAALLLFYPRRGGDADAAVPLPAFLNGCADGYLTEPCAGLLDGEDPQTCIRREPEEETGYRIRAPRKVLEARMCPGSITEKQRFFVATTSRWTTCAKAAGWGGGRGHQGHRDATGRGAGGHSQRAHPRRQDGDAAAACGDAKAAAGRSLSPPWRLRLSPPGPSSGSRTG